MSAAVSQVVFHPTVSHSLRVLGTTLGREKAFRAVQYFSRFLAWFLLRRGSNIEAARWEALKNAMAGCRKMLRLGKPIEHVQAAIKATQLQAPTSEQLTTAARQLGYAGFLTADALHWAHAIKFITFTPDRAQRIAKISFRCWLTAIIFSIGHGLLKAGRLANEAKALNSGRTIEKETIGNETERAVLKVKIQKQREAVRAQMLLDVLDVWIPASNLGLVNLNDGFVGLCGLTTSVIAFKSQWNGLIVKK